LGSGKVRWSRILHVDIRETLKEKPFLESRSDRLFFTRKTKTNFIPVYPRFVSRLSTKHPQSIYRASTEKTRRFVEIKENENEFHSSLSTICFSFIHKTSTEHLPSIYRASTEKTRRFVERLNMYFPVDIKEKSNIRTKK